MPWTVRHVARTTGLVALSSMLLGMGALGGGRDASAPLIDVRAKLVDVDGAAVDVTHLTVGGEPTLDGEVGKGRLRIPLERVTRIDLASASDRDRVRATVTLRDGAPVTLVVRSSTTFYGQLPSGAYQIRARDLRSVDVTP